MSSTVFILFFIDGDICRKNSIRLHDMSKVNCIVSLDDKLPKNCIYGQKDT